MPHNIPSFLVRKRPPAIIVLCALNFWREGPAMTQAPDDPEARALATSFMPTLTLTQHRPGLTNSVDPESPKIT